MSLRMRNTITANRMAVNEENICQAGKAKTLANSELPKRAALGEIGNLKTRQAANSALEALKNKEAVKSKEPVKKPLTTVTQKSIRNQTGVRQTTTSTVRFAQHQSTQSLICKTSTLGKPLRPVVKPTTSSAATFYQSSTLSVKPKIKPTLSKTVSSTSLISKPTVKVFPSIRINVPVLPEDSGVTDIDKEMINSPFFLGEYAGEIYAYMREIEVRFTPEEDFLKGQEINSKMRAMVVDWLVDVQQQFILLIETLHLAIGIFDRFLQRYRTISKVKLQLVGVTSMWIAAKYEEMFHPEAENFIHITDDAYSKKEILKMEQLIHSTLDFRYGQPLSIHFLRRYSKASNAGPKHHTYAKYFLELALVNYHLRHVRPSLIAAVALYIAFCVTDKESEPGPKIWTDTLVFYSTYTYDDLKVYIPVLTKVIIDAKTSNLQAVQKKYKQNNISDANNQCTEILKKLIDFKNSSNTKDNKTSSTKTK